MRNRKKFELQITVDFRCDLQACHFTEKTFREMMRNFQSWGISRVYFLAYPWSSGWWDWTPSPVGDRNARRTYEEVGEFTAAAVKYAHERDIEVFSEFKPFDLGLSALVPDDFLDSPEGKNIGKSIPALGGVWPRCANFLADHPEYLIARNMTGLDANLRDRVVRTIKLVKNDAAPARVDKNNLRLFVSTDNHHYRRYDKPFAFIDRVETRPEVIQGINLNKTGTRREQVRVITIDKLDIPEPYLALTVDVEERKDQNRDSSVSGTFYNLFYKLVELYDDRGNAIPFTYGMNSSYTSATQHAALKQKTFPDNGFMFDVSGDCCNHPGNIFNEWGGLLDKPGQVIGLAKGKNPYHPALCPAYPEVRSYWLSMVKEYLDMGVDGVYFRFPCHQDTMEWNAYGFNQPIVAEYKKRYGVNILTEEFDRVKWRKLRGEYYTLFYREAKALLKKHGKPMQVDITNESYPDPAMPQAFNLHLDWKEWLSFVDAATLKNILLDKDAYHEAKKAAQRHNVPTYVGFHVNSLKNKNQTRIVDLFLKPMMEDGNRGVVMYESRCIWRPQPDSTFMMCLPEVPLIVAPFFQKNEAGRRVKTRSRKLKK